MKKFIALLITASVIAAPVAFADDTAAQPADASAQQMTGTDQAAPAAAKPAAKKHRAHHCNKHRHHTSTVKKAAPVANEPAPAAQ